MTIQFLQIWYIYLFVDLQTNRKVDADYKKKNLQGAIGPTI